MAGQRALGILLIASCLFLCASASRGIKEVVVVRNQPTIASNLTIDPFSPVHVYPRFNYSDYSDFIKAYEENGEWIRLCPDRRAPCLIPLLITQPRKRPSSPQPSLGSSITRPASWTPTPCPAWRESTEL